MTQVNGIMEDRIGIMDRLHLVAEVGSILSLNRAWRAQVTFGTSEVGLNFFFI